MDFFKEVDWSDLRSMDPPFVPNLENDTDTSYFEGAIRGPENERDPSIAI